MFRFVLGGVLLFLCSSCRDVPVQLRGAELCEQIREAKVNHSQSKPEIDSLVRLSAGLSSAERYAVLFEALSKGLDSPNKEREIRFLQSLDSLAFPEVSDKETGFLLLKRYAHVNHVLLQFAPQLFDPKCISLLLFDMENRWKLTPTERLRFLLLKSGIYCNVFKEYKSAAMIIKDGVGLARECGADQEMVMSLFQAYTQSLFRLEEKDQMIALGDDFLELVETCQADSTAKSTIYHTTGMLYEQQGNYRKAYLCLNRTGRINSGGFNSTFTRIYVGMDSIPAALAYLEKKRKENPHPLILAMMAWDEAGIRQKVNDEAGYERCLLQSVQLFDQIVPHPKNEVDDCAPSEAYARMLWGQGKRSEAIERMEMVGNMLLSTKPDYANATTLRFDALSRQMTRFRLLQDYYRQIGRTEDALRQSLLCDSLEQQLAQGRLQAERRKKATEVYTLDLVRNLELRATEFRQEQQKLYFTYFVWVVTLLGAIVLFVLYRRRERQLNLLYARQKEIEQLQVEKQEMQQQMHLQPQSERLSAEERLFRELERRFYEEELFRNPGFSRDDLCRLGGSNQMYVSTCINKYGGSNISQWINKARIDYAIRLIREGEEDLTKLSEQSGFASIKSFFRNFKLFTTLTPRQYIVRDREKREPDVCEAG